MRLGALHLDLIGPAAAQGTGHMGQGGQGGQGGGKKGSGSGVDQGHRGEGGGSLEDRVLRGKQGDRVTPSADEDSDRPPWAGVKGGKAGAGTRPSGAGTKKGDLYGDLYVVLRDANGVPLVADGYPQVLAYVQDVAGNLIPLVIDGQQVIIPRDSEGNLLTEVTVGATTYQVFPQEVEFGRTSVARSPSKVLEKALDTVATAINSATSVTLDASGRLVIDGSTVDSPIENLALYTELMNASALTGSIDLSKLPAGYSPAAFLAASADKTGTINVDYIVYLNSILKVNTVVDGVTTSYYDYSTYNYDRTATWSNVTATVLVLKDGVYVPTEVNVYAAVFNSVPWTDATTTGGADDFAQAADDYLQVIEFLHDNALR